MQAGEFGMTGYAGGINTIKAPEPEAMELLWNNRIKIIVSEKSRKSDCPLVLLTTRGQNYSCTRATR